MRQRGERKPTHNADIVVIATRLKADFASGNRAPRRDRDEQRRMMQFGVARACVTAHVGADPAGALGKPKRLAKARQIAAGLASLASMSRTRCSFPKSRTSAVPPCLQLRSWAFRVFVQVFFGLGGTALSGV